MISERRFAKSYSSVWQEIMPLSDGYWAVENLLTKREAAPVKSLTPAQYRGLVNELGFRTFRKICHDRTKITRDSIILATADEYATAATYINRLADDGVPPVSADRSTIVREAAQIALRLLGFFPDNRSIVLNPKFDGCGIVDSCEGDLIYGNCLFEIKAGDRNFRISDLRQLFVYCSLSYSKGPLEYARIGLFNPRSGKAWTRDIDTVCISVSGLRANDLLPRIVDFISTNSTSR